MRIQHSLRRITGILGSFTLCLLASRAQSQCLAPARLDWVGTNGRPGGRELEEPVRLDIALDLYGNCSLAGFFFLDADLDPTDAVTIVSPMGIEDSTVSFISPDGSTSKIGLIGGGFGESCSGTASTPSGNWFYAGTFGFSGSGDYCGDLDPYEGHAIICATGAPDRAGAYISYVSSEGRFQHGVLLTGDDRIVCSDASGATDEGALVTGYFTGTVDLDPGEGEFVIREYMHRDAYLLKLGESNEFEWGVGIGGYGQDQGQFVTTDATGNIYWMGRFNDLLDFDPGPDEDNRYGQSGEMFVCKYSFDGHYLWTRTVNTKASHIEYSIDAFDDGRVLLGGYFTDIVDFDPTQGEDWREALGLEDGFVSMWGADGEYRWTITLGGEPSAGADAAFDGNGDVIAIGNFTGVVDFDPGPGQDRRISNGESDGYVAKYTRDGQYQWVQTFGGTSLDFPMHLAVNRNNGDIWLDGLFMGTVDFDPGPGEAFRTSVGERDLFLMKMTCDGRGCEELTGHSADGRTGEIESQLDTTLPGGKAAVRIERLSDGDTTKRKARLAADGSGATTFRNLPPGRYRAVVAKLKDAAGTRVCSGEMMERFLDVR